MAAPTYQFSVGDTITVLPKFIDESTSKQTGTVDLCVTGRIDGVEGEHRFWVPMEPLKSFLAAHGASREVGKYGGKYNGWTAGLRITFIKTDRDTVEIAGADGTPQEATRTAPTPQRTFAAAAHAGQPTPAHDPIASAITRYGLCFAEAVSLVADHNRAAEDDNYLPQLGAAELAAIAATINISAQRGG